MSNAQRLTILVALVLAGLATSLVIDPPLVWIVGLAVVVVACIGTDHIVHAHWRVHSRRKRYAATIWILPGLLAAAGFLFLRLLVSSGRLSPGIAAGVGLAVVGFVLAVVIVAQYHTIDPADRWQPRARFALNLVAYLTAFGLYSAIYSTKLRSMFSATGILIITGLICLELFRTSESRVGRTWGHAAVVALVLGEITWALNYWTISPLVGGVFLLLCLYLLSGFVQDHVAGRFDRHTVVEYGVVTLAGFGLLLAAGR